MGKLRPQSDSDLTRYAHQVSGGARNGACSLLTLRPVPFALHQAAVTAHIIPPLPQVYKPLLGLPVLLALSINQQHFLEDLLLCASHCPVLAPSGCQVSVPRQPVLSSLTHFFFFGLSNCLKTQCFLIGNSGLKPGLLETTHSEEHFCLT